MARVCVVDDQELMRDSLAQTLSYEDHTVDAFARPAEALERIKGAHYDVIVSDLKMPGMDGVSLLRALRQAGVDTPVVLMTAYGSVQSAVEAMKLGAFDYITKPFDAEELSLLVDRAIQHGRLRADNEALRCSISDLRAERQLVGDSKAMRQVRQMISQVAQSSATVLIQGESGTGKELVARSVHAASPRADRPLLCLNCAALASNLLESELFGHEKGAFTGADHLRKGRFELSDGGTLMLDEVSEVPMSLQAKLLRVLQEREFERVGSSVTQQVDARVLATTNRNLVEWVSRKRFREDLFYRLSVLPVVVPPLRERLEDVPALVDCFLDRIARREGREPVSFADEALDLLLDYEWPGNVRELENVCERAAVLAGNRCIEADAIRPWLAMAAPSAAARQKSYRPGHILEDMEREAIERMLSQFNGHRERTAKALGIGVRTLGLKLKRWREDDEHGQATDAVYTEAASG
ncbi:MAG: sigma-54-dependent Fis family transcriptional regulator [Phycisphaerae bacterium]|nr:sigma-54-dependent Fis family transcriptional regulator [Phycisphaerae bacterium]